VPVRPRLLYFINLTPLPAYSFHPCYPVSQIATQDALLESYAKLIPETRGTTVVPQSIVIKGAVI
jgi:hypothetical protein